MARLVHLNGPPGIGKSTLSALYADRNPGDREAAIARFNRRARESDDPWIRHHHRLIELGGGHAVLGTMYDNLMEVVRLRPATVVVPSAVGAVQETYQLLADALRERSPQSPAEHDRGSCSTVRGR